MSQTRANLLMLIASFIWGTAFVSQTTGMGTIGPFTFSFSRFFFATIAGLPLALYFEANNFFDILRWETLSPEYITFPQILRMYSNEELKQHLVQTI